LRSVALFVVVCKFKFTSRAHSYRSLRYFSSHRRRGGRCFSGHRSLGGLSASVANWTRTGICLSVRMIIPEHESSADKNEAALGIVSKIESLLESVELRTRLLLALLLGCDWCTLAAGGFSFVFRNIIAGLFDGFDSFASLGANFGEPFRAIVTNGLAVHVRARAWWEAVTVVYRTWICIGNVPHSREKKYARRNHGHHSNMDLHWQCPT